MKLSSRFHLPLLISITLHLLSFLLLFILSRSLTQPAEFGVRFGDQATRVDWFTLSTRRENRSTQYRSSVPLAQENSSSKDLLQKIIRFPQRENNENSPSSKERKEEINNSNKGAGTISPGALKGSNIASPDYLRNPPPEYPEEARENHQEGLVIVQVVVGEKGEPFSVNLQKSSGFELLDESAVRAVKHWKFKPAMKDGVSFESRVEVPIRFRLK